jgi:MFS family permease
LIADSAEMGKHGKAFGLHRAMDTFGAVIGVTLAYLFLTTISNDYAKVFLWSLLPAGVGVGLLALVRERKPERPPKLPVFRWRVLPPRLRLFLIVSLIFTLGNSSNTFLLLRATNLGFPATGAILLYLAYNIVYGVVSYPAGKMSDRFGRKHLLVTGYALYGLVYLGFALVNTADSAWVLWGLFGMYGLYSALTDGIEKAFIADLAPEDIRATAIGLHATLAGIGLFPASFIAGQLWSSVGPVAAFSFGGGMGLAAALALALFL